MLDLVTLLAALGCALVAGTVPRVDDTAGALTVTVPAVLDHEVIAVDV